MMEPPSLRQRRQLNSSHRNNVEADDDDRWAMESDPEAVERANEATSSDTRQLDPSLPGLTNAIAPDTPTTPPPISPSSNTATTHQPPRSDSNEQGADSPPEGEDRQCRICFAGADEEPELGRLFKPCKCKGSMKYVHVGCLNQWRKTTQSTKSFWACDQCHYRYNLARTRASFVTSPVALAFTTTCLLTTLIFLSSFIASYVVPDLDPNASASYLDKLSQRGPSATEYLWDYASPYNAASDLIRLAVHTVNDFAFHSGGDGDFHYAKQMFDSWSSKRSNENQARSDRTKTTHRAEHARKQAAAAAARRRRQQHPDKNARQAEESQAKSEALTDELPLKPTTIPPQEPEPQPTPTPSPAQVPPPLPPSSLTDEFPPKPTTIPPVETEPEATPTPLLQPQSAPSLIYRLAQRFLVGLSFLGIVSFFNLLVSLSFYAPAQVLRRGRRWFGGRRGGDRAGGLDMGTALVILFVAIGLGRAVYKIYLLNRYVARKLLARAEIAILEVADADEEETTTYAGETQLQRIWRRVRRSWNSFTGTVYRYIGDPLEPIHVKMFRQSTNLLATGFRGLIYGAIRAWQQFGAVPVGEI